MIMNEARLKPGFVSLALLQTQSQNKYKLGCLYVINIFILV